jgi:hypothetical protein
MNSWVRALVALACLTIAAMRDHVVAGGPPHCYAQHPGAVMVPAYTSSPGCLSAGIGSPGDAGLMYLAEAVEGVAVRADALAGLNQDDVADLEVGCVHGLLASVGKPGGRFRCQGEQATYGVFGAAGRDGFEGAGGGEDDDQQCAVEGLAGRGGTDRRGDHQQVHV